MSTFIIAECGSCHEGDLRRALDLIEVVRKAGANVAKFQFWSSADRLADRRRSNDYREVYRRYQVPASWLPVLKDACDQHGIEFMATTYLPEDVAVVAPFVKRFKISSFEAESTDLALAHAPFLTGDRTVLMSLGMGANPNVSAQAMHFHYAEWWKRVRLLHCVSAYPAPADAIGLRVFHNEEWRDSFAGLSDHSRHPWMGALAVAAGAQILETHIRLDTTPESNPDYATAFTPEEFAEYVRNVRFAEAAMGSGEKRMQACEAEMARYRVQA
jgi:N,N'-diacetyllegionaminate synthase